MNRISLKIGMAALLLVALCWHNADAIGAWVGGKVTRAPWSDGKYTFLSIAGTKYVVMANTKIDFAYQADGAISKKQIEISSLHLGDTLIAMAEGNRIYQIEKQQGR